jgi:chemotaxis protein MotB
MASDNERPIIIKKVIKVAGHGHHGGSWKVAYADFVTAMMAFFLLLWLLNVTTEEKKMGIADYFAPASISRSQSGSGAILGGSAMTTEGAMRSAQAPQTVVVKIDTPMQEMSDTGEKTKDKEFDKEKDKDKDKDKDNDFDRPTVRAEKPTDATLQKAMAEREQKAFEDSAEQLRMALAKNPDLNGLAKHLLIDQTPEGLRIQIVDQERESMFPGYGNWELSSDRANASRRMLIEAGIQQQRVVQVSGKADTEPLFPTDPFQPGNRRIAIVLLRDAQLAPGSAPQPVIR